ncbi:MAG: MFS transporter [Alphaproteobacteria bacterium]|nr:MFS transporter [Alphaproteobacteria bacterium]
MSAVASNRGLIAWAFYDWANSAFAAVIITFVFATYFSQGIATDPVVGTASWGWAMTASGLVIALLSPVLGAIADAGGRRKPWIFVFTWLCVIGCGLLWTAEPSAEWVLFTLIVVAIANVGFEIATVFYNAMLPDLTQRQHMGRLSGWSWGFGYAGGLACLIFALLAFVQTETPLFGLNRETAEHIRITGPLVGVWLFVFSLPLLFLTPDRPSQSGSAADAVREGLRRLGKTIVDVGRQRRLARFLIAHMLYVDGLNTLFAFGGIYAAGTFGLNMADVIRFGILLNVTAGLGAFAFAWIDDWLGPKRTILIALFGLIVFGMTAVLVTSATAFWITGAMLGIFVGPTQAASRTLMARLAPDERQNEMFGLYALSGKATAFLGPMVLGTVTYWTDSQRLGMATILVFFAAGTWLLYGLDDTAIGDPKDTDHQQVRDGFDGIHRL